jgi:hypothetical protein
MSDGKPTLWQIDVSHYSEKAREPLRERRGFKWVAEMFRRHRKPVKA